jgi:hypothetical protein
MRSTCDVMNRGITSAPKRTDLELQLRRASYPAEYSAQWVPISYSGYSAPAAFTI